MELHIDTSSNSEILLKLAGGSADEIRRIKAERSQSEKLLPEIGRMLANAPEGSLKKIKVASKGEGFTSLRIGVVTANALGYAKGLPVEEIGGRKRAAGKGGFDIVEPQYGKNPNITKEKKKI